MKFDEFFKEPILFTNGHYIVSGEYTKEQAKQLFEKETGDIITMDNISKNKVRFAFPSDNIEDQEAFERKAFWYSGDCGKGSKDVWEYSSYESIGKETKMSIYNIRFSANFPNTNYRNYKQGYEAIKGNGVVSAAIGSPGDIIILLKEVRAKSGYEAITKFKNWQNNGYNENYLLSYFV